MKNILYIYFVDIIICFCHKLLKQVRELVLGYVLTCLAAVLTCICSADLSCRSADLYLQCCLTKLYPCTPPLQDHRNAVELHLSLTTIPAVQYNQYCDCKWQTAVLRSCSCKCSIRTARSSADHLQFHLSEEYSARCTACFSAILSLASRERYIEMILDTMGNLVRAPAPTTPDDCGCQCGCTTYIADSSGIKWCFITPDHTVDACGDAFDYDSRYNLFKSYAACSSPDPYSEECVFAQE